MKQVLVLCVVFVVSCCSAVSVEAGPFRRSGIGHNALVAQSGIRPRQVGSAEGVGASTQGYIAARNNACYWGRKVPLSVQYSKRGNMYYAVVRYR